LEDRVKELASLKAFLERRISSLEEELNALKTMLSMVDEVLSKTSFKPASTLAAAPKETAVTMPERAEEKPLSILPLSTRDGERLAEMEIYPNHAVVRLIKPLSVDIPPFKSFLVNRILEGRKREDEQKVISGEKPREEAFEYEIIEDGEGNVHEIIIRNYGSEDSLRELRRIIRWTLTKMAERQAR